MKLVLATPVYPPEIAETARMFKELARRMAQNHEVTVVTSANAIEPVDRVRCVAVPKKRHRPMRLLSYAQALWEACASTDVVLADSAVAALLPAWGATMLRQKPLIVRLREEDASDRSAARSFMQSLQRFLVRRAKRVIAPTAAIAQWLVRDWGVKEGRVVLSELPAEHPEVLPFAIERSPQQVCLIGHPVLSESDQHAVRIILQDAALAAVRVVCAGDGGGEKRLAEFAVSSGAESRLSLRGDVTHAESWYVRASSSVLLVTDTTGGRGDSAILMGWATGTLVVAVSDAEIPGVVTCSMTNLTETLARVLADEATQKETLARAAAILQERHSWEAVLDRLNRILKSV